MHESCLVYVYRDPDGKTVGFGTLALCKEYQQLTEGKYHCYIPLLAVHPLFRRAGHGRSIVQHLIETSVLIAQSPGNFSDYLFLDVYTANEDAIALYDKCGVVALNPDNSIPDPEQNKERYIIMAKRVTTGAQT